MIGVGDCTYRVSQPWICDVCCWRLGMINNLSLMWRTLAEAQNKGVKCVDGDALRS